MPCVHLVVVRLVVVVSEGLVRLCFPVWLVEVQWYCCIVVSLMLVWHAVCLWWVGQGGVVVLVLKTQCCVVGSP